MLTAYSFAYKHWGTDNSQRPGSNAGYNIGAVLANENLVPVQVGLNNVVGAHNESHHAEVNTMQSFLDTRDGDAHVDLRDPAFGDVSLNQSA